MFRVAFLTMLMSIGIPAFGVTATATGGLFSPVVDITGTITFEGQTATDPTGHATYSGNVFFDGGTSPGSGDWLVQAGSTTVVTFDRPIDYFGLLWGTPDGYNALQLFNGATQVGPTFNGGGGEVYVNFFADPGEQFTSVVLSSSLCCFETDNHSFRLAAASGVPEPGTLLPAAFAAGFWAFRGFRRKRG
jgi:hypothetical protein